MTTGEAAILAAMEPLVVHRSVDRDGATYSLSRRARQRLHERFGDAVHTPPVVFIGHASEEDYRTIHASVRRQVIELLTGLSESNLAELGDVRFEDPVTEKDLGSWSPAHP
jgi:hypothetical protein